MTTDPLAYLRAAHDTAEAEAKAATDGPWWYNPGKQWLGAEAFERWDLRQGEEFVGYGGPSPFVGAVAATGPANTPQSMADAAFIARHDPSAVLRRIAADRQLIELHACVVLRGGGGAAYFDTTTVCRTCEPPRQFPEDVWPCATLRLIAEGWGWTADADTDNPPET